MCCLLQGPLCIICCGELATLGSLLLSSSMRSWTQNPCVGRVPPYLRWAPFSRYEIVRSIAIRATSVYQTTVASSHMFPFFWLPIVHHYIYQMTLNLNVYTSISCTLHFHELCSLCQKHLYHISIIPPNSDLPTNFQFDSRLNQTLCTRYLLIKTCHMICFFQENHSNQKHSVMPMWRTLQVYYYVMVSMREARISFTIALG
jgi:hypothetical protein